ncbi:MAG: aminoglycoside phosphotransferase family protein [Elusimicrobia bacterium]|nr:aminoglycoside phosphotransferase family protein [Elusimicrobiota bacterium]
MEYLLFRVSTDKGLLAVKAATDTAISDDIDDDIDTNLSLAREATVLKHLRAHGAKVPDCLGYSQSAGFPLCVMEFIMSDGTSATDFSIGQALRRVHDSGPWPVAGKRSDELGIDFKKAVLERIQGWLKKLVLRRRIESYLTGAVQSGVFDGYKIPRLTTLHLDVRRDNIIVTKNNVSAILDWGNSIIGDPWLDLLRVEEYSELDLGQFRLGYGSTPPRPTAVVERLYRLYTTSMLSLLFENMVPDSERCRVNTERTIEHLAALRTLQERAPIE